MTPTRRHLLSGIAGLGGALSGCLEAPGKTTARSDPREDPRTTIPLARHGSPPTICEESIHEETGIDAVVDPAFAPSWSDHEVGREYGDLTGETTVVGLAGRGWARAYPVSVLYHHEIVNDVVPAGPESTGAVMVTFCPLCNSGMVAARIVEGEATEFLVSGLLWRAPGIEAAVRERRGDVFGADLSGEAAVQNRGNLVMYDRATRSYWSQILATAICGEMTGTELRILPSTLTTWQEWRGAHPNAEALLPPPHSGTDQKT